MTGPGESSSKAAGPAVLYCHCRYAQVVPADVKAAVLRELCSSGLPFEAVPDLCELSARRDPSLGRLASTGPLKIAACFPRAVKWLFAAANAPLDPSVTEVLNMRQVQAVDILARLQQADLQPNVPTGKVTVADAPAAGRSSVPTEVIPPQNP